MSQWSAIKGPAQFYYSTNYMIDVEHGIILDVEASMTNHASEVATTETMIERIEENHGILPNKLMGDTAYGAAKNLNYLVAEKISSRTFLSGISRHVKMTPCAAMTLFLSKKITNIFAQKVSALAPPVMQRPTKLLFIVRETLNVLDVC
jgi:hypothetical protein